MHRVPLEDRPVPPQAMHLVFFWFRFPEDIFRVVGVAVVFEERIDCGVEVFVVFLVGGDFVDEDFLDIVEVVWDRFEDGATFFGGSLRIDFFVPFTDPVVCWVAFFVVHGLDAFFMVSRVESGGELR